MGLIAEWNRQDLSQFVSAGSPDFDVGGAGRALSVVADSERGNILRYSGGAGGAEITQVFMFDVASGLLMPSVTSERSVDIEIELKVVSMGAAGFFGPFFMGDADTPAHGFGHCIVGAAALEWQTLINNSVVERSTAKGAGAGRYAHLRIRGQKPAAGPPQVSSWTTGYNTNAMPLQEPRRSGSSASARGSVNEFGNGSTLGATWDAPTADRIGLCFISTAGNAAPAQVDITHFRVLDPFESGGGGTAPVITFVSPVAGSTIQRSTPLVVDVTDVDDDISLLCVSARFTELGAEEVVLRGGRFADWYSGSTIASITNGFRLTLRRGRGGWPSTPTMQVDVVDSTGNVS